MPALVGTRTGGDVLAAEDIAIPPGAPDHRVAQGNLDGAEGTPGLAYQDPRGRVGRLLGPPAVEVRKGPGDIDHSDAHGSGQVQQGTPFRMVFVSPPVRAAPRAPTSPAAPHYLR